MPNPDKDGAGEQGEEDKRQAVALQVPAADPPELKKEEVGVPEKRTWGSCSVVRLHGMRWMGPGPDCATTD